MLHFRIMGNIRLMGNGNGACPPEHNSGVSPKKFTIVEPLSKFWFGYKRHVSVDMKDMLPNRSNGSLLTLSQFARYAFP